jgi:hypothetical protein
MSEQVSNPRTALTRLGIVLIALTLVTGPALAVGPVSAAAENAGTTSVRLDTGTTTIKQGTTTTFDIVVTSASGGVGAAEGQVELSNSDVGTITDVSLASSAELTNVDVARDRGSASFRAALMDTQDSGSVTIGTVTVRGAQAGDTDALLSIQALSDESGTAYDTGATPDSSLTVTGSKSTVDLNIQTDSQTVETGSTVEFDVTRADTGAPVRATVSVADTDYSTGVSGTASIEVTEAMVSDAGTVSAVASKASTDEERFRNDTVTLDVGTADATPQPSAGTSTTVVVNLAPMPNGFNKASVTVTAPSGTTISAVDPRLTTDNQFRIADGGVGSNSITVQSVDLAGNVGPTQQTRPIFGLTFDSRPNLDDLSVTVNNLQNDEGNTGSADRVSLSLGKSSVLDSPLPGADVDNPPSDLDGDGLYEDINGDGTKSFEDAVALSFVSASQLDNDEVRALDLDGDGDLDTDDAISLAFQ